MSAIAITELTKRYKDVVALDDISLDVEDGEFLTILGPSGSGKSTILLSIAGFEQPTAGSIEFDGRDVTHLPPDQRRVGLTFQSYALFPHMDVQRNLEFPLRARKVPKSHRREQLNDALRLVQLEGYEHRRPHELSGGQQQRVALARAIIASPDILLLDEPLAALDRQLRQEVQVEIKELQRSIKVTTITVTHDQEEALTMSDRIAVLKDGCLEQCAPPRDLYSFPCSKFVARFIGTANLIEGTVRSGPESATIDCDGCTELLAVPRGTTEGIRTVMVRPEQVRVLPETAGEGLPGIIRSSVYLGSASRLQVEIAPDVLFTVETGREGEYQIGDRVRITWAATDAWIIPDEVSH